MARTPSAAAVKRELRAAALELYREFNAAVFGGQLPEPLAIEAKNKGSAPFDVLPLIWNPSLQKTAGFCTFSKRGTERNCRIELSEKVLDSYERLRSTLDHEMCHAAQWLIDGIDGKDKPHGAEFKKWGKRVEAAFPDMKVSTCHSYEIHYKYRYACTGKDCGQSFGRQSKSFDVNKKVCGKCGAKFALLGAFNRDGTPAPTREPSAFAKYIKAEFSVAKKARPAATHGELMAYLGERWRAGGASAADDDGGVENLSTLFNQM